MEDKMQKIISLCKRRGFVFPSSEIYGGFAAIYDLGPLGVELANNIKKAWWKEMVQKREDIVGLDSCIFMHPKTWEASGHISGFSDPLAECKKCHTRLRVDHLLEKIDIRADEKMTEEEIAEIFKKNKNKIICPECQTKGDFTDVKKFNLLVKSNLGNFTENWQKEPSYLRGETCQGIYLNFKNVLSSSRVKIPFGIAQIGKAFRNEITARQFIFRTREFEQMEMQYFTSPKDEMKEYEKLRKERWSWYLSLGLTEKNLKWHKHDNLVFYAKEAYDIEYDLPFGFSEIEGIHARGNYDLSQHTKFSGSDLSYTDQKTNEKYMPHIIESSCGVGRIMLALLSEGYTEEENRVVLKLKPSLAPYKVAVFPLLANKPELVAKAHEVFDLLKDKFTTTFDDRGNIGKRYYSQDEIGTPYCLTIDFDTLENNTLTLRDRDTTKQERVPLDNLVKVLQDRLQ